MPEEKLNNGQGELDGDEHLGPDGEQDLDEAQKEYDDAWAEFTGGDGDDDDDQDGEGEDGDEGKSPKAGKGEDGAGEGSGEAEGDDGDGAEGAAPGGEGEGDEGDDLEALKRQVAEYKHKFDSERGRNAALRQQLNQVSAPGQQQLTRKDVGRAVAAMQDPEKWKQYKEDYPDEAEAFEERLKADREQIKAELRNEFRTEFQQALGPIHEEQQSRFYQEQENLLALPKEKGGYGHSDWLATVQSKEFAKWLADQPEPVQQLKYSNAAADAAYLIGTFKATHGKPSVPDNQNGQGNENSDAARVAALKKKRQQQLRDGQGVDTRTRTGRQGIGKADDFDSAWEEFAKKKEKQLKAEGRL